MMKKIVFVFLILMLPGFVFAGELGNIMGSDILLGTVVSSAIGSALSIPAYVDGGDDASLLVFAAGAGWGALIGAGVGLIYGIVNLTWHVREKGNMRSKLKIDTEKINVGIRGSHILISKKF